MSLRENSEPNRLPWQQQLKCPCRTHVNLKRICFVTSRTWLCYTNYRVILSLSPPDCSTPLRRGGDGSPTPQQHSAFIIVFISPLSLWATASPLLDILQMCSFEEHELLRSVRSKTAGKALARTGGNWYIRPSDFCNAENIDKSHRKKRTMLCCIELTDIHSIWIFPHWLVFWTGIINSKNKLHLPFLRVTNSNNLGTDSELCSAQNKNEPLFMELILTL